MKKSLQNIKKAVIEIATYLAKDKTLCKLLLNDTKDALNQEAPDVDINYLIQNNYISICPPVENRIEEYKRNTFLSILIDNVVFSKDKINGSIIIYISTTEEFLLLNDNLNRLIESCDRIIQVLDNKKLSCAGTLSVSSMSHTMLSDLHPAYRIVLRCEDQNNGNGEV